MAATPRPSRDWTQKNLRRNELPNIFPKHLGEGIRHIRKKKAMRPARQKKEGEMPGQFRPDRKAAGRPMGTWILRESPRRKANPRICRERKERRKIVTTA